MYVFAGVQVIVWDSEEETGDPDYPTSDRAFGVVYFPDVVAVQRASECGLMPDSTSVDPSGNVAWVYDDGGHPDLFREWLRNELGTLLDNGASWLEADYAPDRGHYSTSRGAGYVNGEMIHHADDDTVIVVLPSEANPLARLVVAREHGTVFVTSYATILHLECDAHNARSLCEQWGIRITNE